MGPPLDVLNGTPLDVLNGGGMCGERNKVRQIPLLKTFWINPSAKGGSGGPVTSVLVQVGAPNGPAPEFKVLFVHDHLPGLFPGLALPFGLHPRPRHVLHVFYLLRRPARREKTHNN